MTKPQYASVEERKAALRAKARKQMLAQWEQKRSETGDPLGYFGGHKRVRKERGPAKLEACFCGKQAHHWALEHDKDGSDPAHYQAMCQSCHWAYDRVGERQAQRMTSAEASRRAHVAWETKRRAV